MSTPRLRDLGIVIGQLPTGQHNAITDVSGVLVGHSTIIADEPTIARTGVTVIVPRDGGIWHDHTFAGFFSFNGFGEMTGTHWIAETGMLATPIAITNTVSVGTVSDALYAHAVAHEYGEIALPVVAETYDGILNTIGAFHVRAEHVEAALQNATGGPVAEGNVGGGTGMICHQFKGGIGSASRVATTLSGSYTVGALVQSNYGARRLLRVDGVPVGREISGDVVPLPRRRHDIDGSIIVVLATDAPLLPIQCQRLAKRATSGLAQVGGIGFNGSGDIFIAFATGNHLLTTMTQPHGVQMLPNEQMDSLFEAATEAVNEAILNSLIAAETMTGLGGATVHALPHDLLQQTMARYGRN